MSWTWYLANDMQFFIVSVAVIFLYLGNQRAGKICAWIGVLVASVLEMVIMTEYPEESQVQNYAYDKPYCRIAPALLGLLMGFFLRENDVKTWQISQKKVLAMRFVSFYFLLHYGWLSLILIVRRTLQLFFDPHLFDHST